MSMQLRPYQQDLFDRIQASMRAGRRSILAVAPCGAGKTVLFCYMAHTVVGKGMRMNVLVHRDELVDQVSATLGAFAVPHSFIAAGRDYNPGLPVQVCSVQTLAKRLERQAAQRYHPRSPHYIHAPNLVVPDEAHHAVAGSWRKVSAHWSQAYTVGFTASPQRLDGKGLGDVFDDMVLGPSVSELIELGALCRYRLYAPGGIRTEGVHTVAGDFNKAELAQAADRPTITGDAIAHYRRHAPGKRAIVFCTSVQHAKHVALEFQAAGFQAAWLEGEMFKDARRDTVNQFKAGRIQILTSCDLVSEGFDLPAIECAIMLRPTQSLALWIQQAGRALRPMPGKTEAILLDHAGNAQRLGLPDEDRDWTLGGSKGHSEKDEEKAPPVRVCPKCFAAQLPGTTACRYCGAAFPVKVREVEHVEGDLVEIDPEEIRRRRLREQGHARTEAQLVALGEARGYKRPRLWARHIILNRNRRPTA